MREGRQKEVYLKKTKIKKSTFLKSRLIKKFFFPSVLCGLVFFFFFSVPVVVVTQSEWNYSFL